MTLTFVFLTVLFGALSVGLALDLHHAHSRARELEAEKRAEAGYARELAHRLQVSERANARLTNELAPLRRALAPPEPRDWSLGQLLRDPP